MHCSPRDPWDRFCGHRVRTPELTADVSRVQLEGGWLVAMEPRLEAALDAMAALEAGALANADEDRRVGHYWLRAPERAPSEAIGGAIGRTVEDVKNFAAAVRSGSVGGADGSFEHVLHVGIGGSALGAQLLCDALDGDALEVSFLDNADPDGLDRVLARRRGRLGRTLVSVVSKCGRTPTPMLVLRELEDAYRRAGLSLDAHAVATTMEGSELDARARRGWRACFPLWEWVGGRTSITSAVGLLPMALRGGGVDELLAGAAAMDRWTRSRPARRNPAALLAGAWYGLGAGRGDRAMVVLPYRDRLATLSRWAQQLVMESIGKRLDRRGRVVEQGLTVYGGKGATDQHAYLQQLRDGRDDAFLVFVATAEERVGDLVFVAPEVTLGDRLFGNLLATREALSARGRSSITITLPDASARSLGALVALFERAVGLYAELVDINAYHQPGVDKDAGASILVLQRAVLERLAMAAEPLGAVAIAEQLGRAEDAPLVLELLERLAHDPRRGVRIVAGDGPDAMRFQFHP